MDIGVSWSTKSFEAITRTLRPGTTHPGGGEDHRWPAQIIDRAHALGLKVIGCTLTPFEGTTFPGDYSPAGEIKRQAVNQWIRTSGAYDAVIDFDAATRDPSHPTRLRPAYDSGDHLHPNDTGYRAMADAINLSLFNDDD